jgi:hypothetical protein
LSSPVCYLIRSDRGAHMLGLRVVSLDDQATWQSPDAEPDSAPADARAAAEWLAERLSRNGKAISRLIIDTDGGVCSWVSTSDTSPEVVRALVEQPFDQEDAQGSSRFPEMPGETALETLGESVAGKKSDPHSPIRTAVFAVPVVPARLLLDELDRLGIRVGEVEVLWHAIAQAWDPAARSSLGGSKAERVIAETTPVTGVVVLDPAGRLVWAWSRAGKALAGGTQRLQTLRTVETEPDRLEQGSTRQPIVTEADLARLGTDWLSWSMQLGVTPTRIVVVGQPAEVDGGLDSAGIGRTLGKIRPDAPIDIVPDDDPIGTTLAQLAGRNSCNEAGITELTNRPGRTHRAMYRWSAVALLLAAGAVGVAASRFLNVADEINIQIADLGREYLGIANDNNLNLATASLDLERKIEQLEKEQVDVSSLVDKPRPLLKELEALSFVLASDDLTLREITMSELSITVKVQVDETETYEALSQAISSIAGSVVEWRSTVAPRGQNILECTFTGSWPRREGEN